MQNTVNNSNYLVIGQAFNPRFMCQNKPIFGIVFNE